MSFISRLFGKGSDKRDALRPLWHRVVEIAREKPWYAQCGVADTVPGRFDAVTLVLAIVMLRMEREERLIAPSVYLTELFVDDMDGQLRQSGVGDLVVGKRMGKLMGVLGGRIAAMREGLAEGGDTLRDALVRNVSMRDGTAPDALAERVSELAAQIDAASADDLLAGRIAR
ncbi:ubiquinol-cytochrome C chaperone family protein [Novosphingobium aquimarinum]|uniref:ubiquinol-cytochrome C chaperone family protein n=1 Tax=Novosphingobium aquimarinum TaxID=2682494 RepID=UPI0012EC655D|nr:ubiquinol-cytochrome C chaperone family protein [Novosphingobium aquimarinum]